jgi:excinuclease ABC subunit A
MDRYKNHSIEAVVDRLVVRYPLSDTSEEAQADRSRLTDSIETALRLGGGTVIINDVTDGDNPSDQLYSEHLSCAYDGTSIPEIAPRTFSFNSPHGACPACQGLGTKKEIDSDLVIPNKDLSLKEGAIVAWPTDDKQGYYWQLLKSTADHFAIPTDVPVHQITDAQLQILFYGSGQEEISVHYVNREGHERTYRTNFEGVISNLERRYLESTSDYVRNKLEEYMVNRNCRTCDGTRLQPVARAVDLFGETIASVTGWPVSKILDWANCLRQEETTPLTGRQQL